VLSVAFGCVDVAGFELVGYTSGLSAGLEKALADLDDADLMAAARAGWAAVPAQRVHEGASVLEHHMATSEGVAIIDVRLPAGLVPLRHVGDRPEVVGLRLAAVRIGLARKLLDLAIGALTDGRPLLHHVLLLGAITDVLGALAELRARLEEAALWPSRAAVVDVHHRLTRLDWQVAKLFGLQGDLADHPVRALFVAELVAGTWVGS
jgi:hypothetical protein